MGIAEEIALFEEKLSELIRKYEQYFLGLEKREPIKLLEQVERTARRYVGASITNTMAKFKYNSQVARLNSYKMYWIRITRLMEDGKYSRDIYRMELNRNRQKQDSAAGTPPVVDEFEQFFKLYVEARKACNMEIDKITPDMIKAVLEKERPALQKRHNCEEIIFKVVIENGKPKIKARPKS